MRKIFTAVLLTACILSLFAMPSHAARLREEKNTYFIEDAEGSAAIKNGNKKAARDAAIRAAYRDAIDQAMEMFAGDSNADMKNRVFAKSQSLVKNFKATRDEVSGDTYYITGSCTVGARAFDGVLGPEVIAMLGNPRVMIIVDEESGKNASLVENELLRLFEKAGYLIVDKDQAQTLLALDPKKAFSDPEALAGAAKTTRADIIIVAHASSGAAHAQRFGIHMYKPSGTVQIKAVLTKTAYQISSSTISRGTKNWQGSSSAAGLITSGLRQAAEEIIYKIAYKMASPNPAFDGRNVNIRLAGASFEDVETLTEYLRETGQVFDRGYSKELTELDLVSPKNARNVASLISKYKLPGGQIEIDGLTAETVSARVRPVKAQEPKPEPKPDVQYVIINVYLEKLDEKNARTIESELKNFVGSIGEVQGEYNNKILRVSLKFVEGSDGAKNVYDIESFLKNDIKSKGIDLLVDKPEGNLIKGSVDRIFWW